MAGQPISLVVRGHARPSVRITERSKWTPAARRYLEWQNTVAHSCLKLREIPVRWKRIRVSYVFWVHNRRADLTNIIKSTEDGLVHGHLMVDDRAVVETHARVFSCSEKDERVEILVEEAE